MYVGLVSKFVILAISTPAAGCFQRVLNSLKVLDMVALEEPSIPAALVTEPFYHTKLCHALEKSERELQIYGQLDK